jgi:AraC-like DNA-binding protein
MQKNALRYLPPAPGAELWGLVVTGAGYCRSLPGQAYPPERHPDDHMYEWDRGRVLPCFQILGLLEGSGELESSTRPPQRLVADSAFLIAPGQWHRFRPNPKTGWIEIWIEFQGLVPNALSGAGQLGEALVVRTGVGSSGLWVAMDAVLQRVRNALPGVNPSLATLALEALAAWNRVGQEGKEEPAMTQALSAAVEILNRDYRTPVNLPALAKRVGISYSAFRHAFRKHTGFAPWQYVRHLRLAYARHRLAISADSLIDLADALGFSSPYHLSTAFRKEFGHSPSQWRNHSKRNPFAG